MITKALLFLLLVFTYTISCSSSRKASTELDLSNLTEVIHFVNSTTPCEQISYIEAQKEQVVTDTTFGSLILVNISKGGKRKFYMPVANGNFVIQTEFKMEVLQEQLDSLKLEWKCK